MNRTTNALGGTAWRAHLGKALPWLWLAMSAAWAVVIFTTDQLAWPLALWIATTVGPLTARSTRLDEKVSPRPADEREEAAQRYIEQLRAFYVHAAVYAGSMTIIIAVNLFVNLSAGIADQWSAWWSIWALIGWGAGIAVHGLVVRLNRPSLAPSAWEQRQIQKMLGTERDPE